MKRLHRIFAVSSLLLLATTVWLLVNDHRREWKVYQRTSRDLDLRLAEWQKHQSETSAAWQERQRLQAALDAVRGEALDMRLVAAFRAEVARDAERRQVTFDFGPFDEACQHRPPGAGEDVAVRAALLARMQAILAEAQLRETRLRDEQKSASADVDAAKSKVMQAVRDGRSSTEIDRVQAVVDQRKQALQQRTLAYQTASDHRLALAETLRRLTAKELELAAAWAQSRAEVQRLETEVDERRSTYFTFHHGFPLPGKKFLELPILDAFNSPLKIENLWSEGLTQDFNFREVRRFDRCTTCHQELARTWPGAPTEAALAHEQWLTVTLSPLTPAGDIPPRLDDEDELEDDPTAEAVTRQVEEMLGIRVAEGLLQAQDVTVSYVRDRSAAAQADVAAGTRHEPADDAGGNTDHTTPSPRYSGERVGVRRPTANAERGLPPSPGNAVAPLSAEEIQRRLLATSSPSRSTHVVPGLLPGDVLVDLDGEPLFGLEHALARLHDAADQAQRLQAEGRRAEIKPLSLTIRRGLPQPYAGHPRLDLFVGASSPHKMADFGCTICHEGQGSATAFQWASHTPNSEPQRQAWRTAYGWFDNPHWEYPMVAQRFAESVCLKCHHRVVELLPSTRFPEPPAPQLLRGYQLIQTYGCFGCHEINGFEGDKSIGPDVRVEPNYAAVAQELAHQFLTRHADEHPAASANGSAEAALPQPTLPAWEERTDLASRLAADPHDAAARRGLRQLLERDAARAKSDDAQGPAGSSPLASLGPLLKDQDHPGTLRKVGPSLRHVGQKLEEPFLLDWVGNPQHFRASTRMPRFFGTWEHLEGHSQRVSEDYEPIEIRAVVAYLLDRTQPIDDLAGSPGVTASTPEDKAGRGKHLFQTRGCLACHDHQDFPDAAAQRDPQALVAGPELSNLGPKLRHGSGRRWLYSWIKQPAHGSPRTLMPDLQLTPVTERNADGNPVAVTDPVEDLVEYFLRDATENYPPDSLPNLDPEKLADLVREYLRETFHESQVELYARRGIPPHFQATLRPAEHELLVSAEQHADQAWQLPEQQKLRYLGHRTILKLGCYACHDIPGFEAAKPIGPALSDWGRKDPRQLAFEQIVPYLHAQGESASGVGNGPTISSGPLQSSPHTPCADMGTRSVPSAFPSEYYLRQILSGNRVGFLYQKLTEPRSYDYRLTENKRYNERLRMPRFPLSVADREAVMTFVLGLVGRPPTERYVYQPAQRRKALLEGEPLLQRYQCATCHLLQPEKWHIVAASGSFAEQQRSPSFPFSETAPSTAEVQTSALADRAGRLHATLAGVPMLGRNGKPMVFDEAGDELTDEETFSPDRLEYVFQLWQPAALEGREYQVGVTPVTVPAGRIAGKAPARGGFLAKYLLPHVVALEKLANPSVKGSEAWGWVPPPLVGEGAKAQTAWLHSYLLDPQPVRPAAFLRMPKFNLGPDEATKLVDYLAAADGADYPYDSSLSQRAARLEQAERRYQDLLQRLSTSEHPLPGTRLDHAMHIVTNKNFCIGCHRVGNFEPKTSERAKGPDLAQVHKRLRPDYVRRWIAKPMSLLPYTPMPAYIPYLPGAANLGGIDQSLYHGTSVEQVDGLLDLLMNFDEYAKSRQAVTPTVTETAR